MCGFQVSDNVVSKSMMCLRDKVGHSGEEVSDLG